MPSFNELKPYQQFFFARIFPWFIVLVGGFSMYLGAASIHKSWQSTDWPTAEGKIVESGIRAETTTGSTRSSTTYHANVVYEYLAEDGEFYTGKRVSYGEHGRENEVHATEISNRYPQGETVTIYYDPDKPSESVLEPGLHGIPWFFLVMGIPFMIFGFGLAYFMPKMAAKPK